MEHKQELEDMIETVIREGASDLHLSEGRQPTIRVAGNLIPLAKKPRLTREDTDSFLTLLMNKENKDLFLQNKEMDFSLFVDNIVFNKNDTVGVFIIKQKVSFL